MPGRGWGVSQADAALAPRWVVGALFPPRAPPLLTPSLMPRGSARGKFFSVITPAGIRWFPRISSVAVFRPGKCERVVSSGLLTGDAVGADQGFSWTGRQTACGLETGVCAAQKPLTGGGLLVQ